MAMTELEQLQLEEQQYKVELLRDQMERLRAQKASAARQRADQAATEAFNRKKVAREQEACAHKKGGTGIAGIFTGNDSNYSIIKHTEPWGETYVKCQRCGKEWRDPFFMMRRIYPAKLRDAIKKVGRAAYDKTMKEYNAALSWPTDNSPSGGAIFSITRQADMEDAA